MLYPKDRRPFSWNATGPRQLCFALSDGRWSKQWINPAQQGTKLVDFAIPGGVGGRSCGLDSVPEWKLPR